MARKFRNGRVLVALLPLLLCGAIRLSVADEKSLTGRVYDTTGLPLSGVTVFLTMVERAVPAGCSRSEHAVALRMDGTPVRVAKSDADGVFSIDLSPGRYRVAAFKRGYDVAVTDVNTLARAFFNLQMHPAPRVVLGDLPVGSAGDNLGLGWILRQQPSDVLRDERPGLDEIPAAVWLAAGDGKPAMAAWPEVTTPAPRSATRALFGPVEGEFAQLYAGAGLRAGSAESASGPADRSTDLTLRGAIGGEGSWHFDGWRGRSSADLGGEGGRQGRRSDRLAFNLDYELGPQDSLKTEARYSSSHYVVDPDGATVDATDQEQRTLGFRSRWDRKLGDVATLYVDGSYFESGVRLPEPLMSPIAALPGDEGGRNNVFDRVWETISGLTFAAGHHQFDVGVGTKTYRYDLRDQGILLYSLEDAPSLTETGERGSAVSLFGSDRWSPGERYEIDYGLRYHTAVAEGPAYMVPRVGLTRRASGEGSLTLRSMVLFRLDDPGLSSTDPPPGSGRERVERPEAGHLGYMVGVERRPHDGLQVSATLSYRPFAEGIGAQQETPAPLAFSDGLLFLSDGAAGRRELLVELAHNLGAVRGTLTGGVGTVQGMMTPALEEAPVQILSQGEARYYRTGLRAFIVPSDTEVQVDFRRVQAEPGGGSAASPVDYRRLDLVVSQNLPWVAGPSGARFRVLMAYQGLFYQTLFDAAASGAAASGTASRISGGVDIRF